MPPTLASLVQHPGLKLAVRAGEDRLDVPVRWAHVSELADPVPYMEGGELLLVTALKLDAENPEAMRAYVRRLVRAGVVGLGFAVGVYYPDVPRALVKAAQEERLPLLEVPRRTPFLAISKAVSAAMAAEQYQAVTTGFETQRELTRAALAPEGPAALLARLATALDGWAALYDASGAVVAAAPSWAARRASRLTPDVQRLRERGAQASAVIGDPGEPGAEAGEGARGDRVELQSLGSGGRTRAVLAVGTAGALGTAERYAVNSAAALLTLTTERSRALHQGEERLGAAVLRLLLAGEPGHARTVAGRLYGGLLDGHLRVLVVEAPSGGTAGRGALSALVETVEVAAARAGEAVLAERSGPRLVLLTGDGGAAGAACRRHAEVTAEGNGAPPVVGVSSSVRVEHVARAHQQAEQALSVARRRGRAVAEYGEVATESVLPLLADEAVRAFADGLLRALREHDAHGRGDLVASLRAWLSRHGQWDAAAAELGVHRHTLRYRMRRVEEILGRSLDDPDVRMELWLALKTSDLPGPRPPAG